MSIHRKKDYTRIESYWRQLRSASWLGPARKWWPDYLFHFTDIENAIRIIEGGKLVSRSQGKIAKDIASQTVINQTGETWKDHVRLYFRPRTPTQYQNEGFRPQSSLGSLQAHCPMPIFFLFDTISILCWKVTQFSDGNLAAGGVRIGDDAEFLESISFEKVYHDSPLSDAEKRNIIYHRHAEVLVPKELPLDSLKWIACRSEAELRTLQHLLPAKSWHKYSKRIKLGRQVFNRRWTFVETAELEQQKVTIRFNPVSATPGPFSARLDIQNLAEDKGYFWRNEAYNARDVLRIRIPQLTTSAPYEVRLTLDGSIAFADKFVPESSIFDV